MRRFVLFIVVILTSHSVLAEPKYKGSVQNIDCKQWSMWCRADVLDDYGDIRFHRHCTAYVVLRDEFKSVPIFQITDSHYGVASATEPSDCDYQPQRIAVDGRRIDNFSQDEQLAAVLKGKTLTREMWKLHWPECEFSDLTVDISGAQKAWATLLSMKKAIYDKNIAFKED